MNIDEHYLLAIDFMFNDDRDEPTIVGARVIGHGDGHIYLERDDGRPIRLTGKSIYVYNTRTERWRPRGTLRAWLPGRAHPRASPLAQ